MRIITDITDSDVDLMVKMIGDGVTINSLAELHSCGRDRIATLLKKRGVKSSYNKVISVKLRKKVIEYRSREVPLSYAKIKAATSNRVSANAARDIWIKHLKDKAKVLDKKPVIHPSLMTFMSIQDHAA